MFELVNGYRDNDTLRKSFNDLSVKTFHLSLEDWYQNGFWGEKYNPYSIIVENEVVANVSVSITNFKIDGEIKYFLQLGNVATSKEYRNKGLIRQIISQIEADYSDKVDGIYLFANDSVLDFYPKFGFEKSKEYEYSKRVINEGKCQFEKAVMDNPDSWKKLENVMKKNVFYGKFDMIQNDELIMFYVTKFMQENVYYHGESETYVIAEIENGDAFIHNVFSGSINEMDDIILLFGKEIKNITLGFTPVDMIEYETIERKEENCTFFIKGEALKVIEKEKLRIPSLAHA